jgi:thymidylate kinase
MSVHAGARPDVELLRYLSARQVRYALLHGLTGLFDGSLRDVDLVVHPDDLQRCIHELRKWNGFTLVQLFRYEATGYGLVLARCTDEWESLVIDLATDYRCRGRIFFTGDELIDARHLIEGIWHVRPERELACLLVKKFYEKDSIPEHQRRRIEQLTTMLGPPASGIYRSLLGERVGREVHAAIASRNWTTPVDRMREVKKAIGWRAALKNPLRLVRYRATDCARRIGRVARPTGMIVALLGPDGAGKSTLARQIPATVSGPFRRVSHFHFRPRLLGRARAGAAPVLAVPPRGRWMSALKVLAYVLDYWIGYLFVVRPALARSTLVLFDRYFHDLLVDPARYRYGGPRWLVTWCSRLVPRPDLCLIVVADAEELHRRKGELSVEEAGDRVKKYINLADRLEGARIIQGNLSVNAALAHVQEAVLATLSQRHGAAVAAKGLTWVTLE